MLNPQQEIEETPAPPFAQITSGYFREGRGYHTRRPHGTQDWLLILTLGGAGRFQGAEGDFIARENEVTLYRPGAFQDYKTDADTGNWELVWAHFLPRPYVLPLLDFPEVAPGLLHLQLLADHPDTLRLTERLKAMQRYSLSAVARREEFALNALEEALLLCDLQNPNALQSRLDPRIRQAMEFLSVHLHETLTMQSVAEGCAMSLSRFGHLFREQTGETPGQFLERQRMERARQLLRFTSRTVTAIAEEVGYESAFYFTNRFRKLVGMSPRDYRAQ